MILLSVYLEVSSAAELKDALMELRNNRQLYREMVDHGFARARSYSAAAVSRAWQDALRTDVTRAFDWRHGGRGYQIYSSVRDTVEYFTKFQHWKDLLTITRH